MCGGNRGGTGDPAGTNGGAARGETPPPVSGGPEPEGRSFLADLAELVYGIFFSPVETLREVASRPRSPLAATFTAYLVVVFTGGLASGGVWVQTMGRLGQAGGMPAPAGAGLGVALALALASVLIGPILLFVKTGVLGLVSALLGGSGDPRRLLAALSLTYVPAVVTVPFGLLSSGSPALGALSALLTIAVLVWRLALDIIALREVHHFGTGRAVAAALVPPAALVLAGVVFFMIVFTTMAGLFAPFAPPGLPGY
jgi:hypothetical protein